MKKPANRKDRIDFILKKHGNSVLPFFATLTDSEVKHFFNDRWNTLKLMPDNQYPDEPEVICLRCGHPVIIEHHYFCGCGDDRAVFDDQMWQEDIASHTERERLEGDDEFIKNGFQSASELK